MLLHDGIPIVYYGAEQLFNGCNDPDNREPLWTTGYKTDTEMYSFLGKIVDTRKKHQVWKEEAVERWVDDTFYAWSKGDVFVATTNQDNGTQSRKVTFLPYQEGQTVCNVHNPSECITVQGGALEVSLEGGAKVFAPKTSLETN